MYGRQPSTYSTASKSLELKKKNHIFNFAHFSQTATINAGTKYEVGALESTKMVSKCCLISSYHFVAYPKVKTIASIHVINSVDKKFQLIAYRLILEIFQFNATVPIKTKNSSAHPLE